MGKALPGSDAQLIRQRMERGEQVYLAFLGQQASGLAGVTEEGHWLACAHEHHPVNILDLSSAGSTGYGTFSIGMRPAPCSVRALDC